MKQNIHKSKTERLRNRKHLFLLFYKGGDKMKNMYDVRQLLKRYNIFIYTGNRSGDAELMELEIRSLYDAQLIDVTSLQQALLILRKEAASTKK